jgi:serralysin
LPGLHGQAGNDRLIGGDGKDRFFFETSLSSIANVDKVQDFSPRDDDEFVLSRAIFTDIGARLAKGEFNVGRRAEDDSDRIVYNRKSGVLSFDDDGRGGDAAVPFAIVDARLNLTHNDFEMIA